MATHNSLTFGPRLVATPTGRLLTAVLVRPAPSIEKAKPLIGEPGAIYARAREQHNILQKTLEYFGVETIVVESRGADPYDVAIADTAVAFEDGAVVMRLSSMSRRGEADRVESEFSRLDVPLAGHIAAPGLLDGNDVLLVGETAFIGVGARGNDIGRRGFARLATSHGYRVVEVKLAPDVQCLRAVAGAIASDTIVLGATKLDASAFDGFRTISLERGEESAAGVLCLNERHVVADIRYRTSLAAMRRAGVRVESIDLYEFTKLGITPSMLTLALKRE